MIIAWIHLGIIRCFKAPISNSIALFMLTVFIQLCSAFSKIEHSHSRQKIIGVTCPFFKLLTVENMWNSLVCLHLQISASLNIAIYPKHQTSNSERYNYPIFECLSYYPSLGSPIILQVYVIIQSYYYMLFEDYNRKCLLSVETILPNGNWKLENVLLHISNL